VCLGFMGQMFSSFMQDHVSWFKVANLGLIVERPCVLVSFIKGYMCFMCSKVARMTRRDCF